MRSSGILMHISSLPSPYGIGTLGRDAKRFAEFLKAAGQAWWQMLPVGTTGFGDSPYQSFSSFAGNPYFIDLEILCEQGLLAREECDGVEWGTDPCRVDYEKLYNNHLKVLRLARNRFARFGDESGYLEFCGRNRDWLEDYALFAAIKAANGGAAFFEWDEPLKFCKKAAINEQREKLRDDIDFYKSIQYWFFSQWFELKKYVNSLGIKIIGDLPIYVAHDSAEFWANPNLFLTDSDGNPALVAGVPPDSFAEKGQLWGNPIYDWHYHKRDGYAWWIKRIKQSMQMFDSVRIDHFRGFEAFYAVPAKDPDAVHGKWHKGPGMALFNAAKSALGELPLIAEDLGYITPSLKKFLDATGFPGMKVMQFAFDPESESDYLPYKYTTNSVVYTGTHDNDTINGWMQNGPKEQTLYAKRYLRLNDMEGYNWGMMKAALASASDTCILTMQDLIGMNSDGRMNTPSTTQGNWTWRILPGCTNDWLAEILKEYTRLYKR